MIDLTEPHHQLFEYKGVLHKVIGWSEGPTVIIEPLDESAFKKCECGRPFPNQQTEHVLSSRNLQEGITAVYEKKPVKENT